MVDGGRDAAGGLGSDGGNAADGTSGASDAPLDAWIDTWKCEGVDRSPADAPCTIDEAYGVFVAPTGNDATGLGTRSAPFKTLGKGLQAAAAKATGKRLYVCDNGTGYAEPITIDGSLDGLSLFGGFRCSDWTYATSNRAVIKPPASPALRVEGTSLGVLIENFAIQAPDAVDAAPSSFGAMVNNAAKVVMRRVKIAAGVGAKGQPGVDGVAGANGSLVTASQKGRDAACGDGAPGSQVGGSWPNLSACGAKGGNGGPANKGAVGYEGLAGDPTTSVTPPGVNNGGGAGPTGGDGATGSVGDYGAVGSVLQGSGTFSSNGYTPATPGEDGAHGSPGQGGGGGGASHATATCIGASGGAGGEAGCGGTAGTGGRAGGASVALLVWMSGLSLDACELLARDGGAGGKGGNGGPGGAGQEGASGGMGDVVNNVGNAGRGGPGGNGGPGGSGAGGNGGPSYALVYSGTAPAKLNAPVQSVGLGGAGGPGGSVQGVAAPNGLSGAAAAEFVVP